MNTTLGAWQGVWEGVPVRRRRDWEGAAAKAHGQRSGGPGFRSGPPGALFWILLLAALPALSPTVALGQESVQTDGRPHQPERTRRVPATKQGYDFFEHGREHPFGAADQARFDVVNASWCADAALLAYLEPARIERECRAAGIVPEVIEERANRVVIFRMDADSRAIVAFRGTVTGKNWLANLNFFKTKGESYGKVHRGFKNALDQVWERLQPRCEALIGEGYQLWLTGHSLGAAMATLACARLDHGTSYTFGGPRVGDKKFFDRYAGPTYRLINGDDRVPDLPPHFIGFRHVGLPVFITHDGNLTFDPDAREARWHDTGIDDHKVRTYATTLWNAVGGGRRRPSGTVNSVTGVVEVTWKLGGVVVETPQSTYAIGDPQAARELRGYDGQRVEVTGILVRQNPYKGEFVGDVVYRVLGPSSLRAPADPAAGEGLTPLLPSRGARGRLDVVGAGFAR